MRALIPLILKLAIFMICAFFACTYDAFYRARPTPRQAPALGQQKWRTLRSYVRCDPQIIDYIEKDVPQPQELLALGLSIVKRAPINSSVKSIVAPAKNGKDTLSTTTFWP